MKYITVKTLSPNTNGNRNVTLCLNRDGSVSLLGNLEHNTTILIGQELIDQLARIGG